MPRGMGWPAIVVSLFAIRVVIGTVGYKRTVSLQTPLRRGSRSRMPAISKLGSVKASGGSAARISSRSLRW